MPGSGLLIDNQAPSQAGTPGTSGNWSFTVTTQNCAGGDLRAMKFQDGTAGWMTNATGFHAPKGADQEAGRGKNLDSEMMSAQEKEASSGGNL